MIKRTLSLVLVSALALGTVVPASAIGGSSEDPLISLSYLRTTLQPQLSAFLHTAFHSDTGNGRLTDEAILPDEGRYKEGDTLSASTGAEVIVLAGDVQFTSGGVIIDASHGVELPPTAALQTNTRYITAEDTTAHYTVLSPTAVISCNGNVSLQESTLPDYNAMADALSRLSLLKGTGTGFGSGYDLEKTPTRIEAIVMFIRLLGEEQAALSSTATHPFKDVAPWADRYVAYAYEKGYSNGAGKDVFASSRSITVKEYVEFVMRALRYSSTAHTDLSTTLEDAKNASVLTPKEFELLTSVPLLRAHLVYISFYAVSTKIADESRTLAEKLIAGGVFTSQDYQDALAMVKTQRLQ